MSGEHTCDRCTPKVCKCPFDCDGRVTLVHYCEHHEANKLKHCKHDKGMKVESTHFGDKRDFSKPPQRYYCLGCGIQMTQNWTPA